MGKQRQREELRLRTTEKLHRAVEDYASAHGMSLSGAVRDLIRKQLRYWKWIRVREGQGPSHDTLRHYGRVALEKRPDATKSQVAWFMAKKSGRFMDADTIEKIADELLAR